MGAVMGLKDQCSGPCSRSTSFRCQKIALRVGIGLALVCFLSVALTFVLVLFNRFLFGLFIKRSFFTLHNESLTFKINYVLLLGRVFIQKILGPPLTKQQPLNCLLHLAITKCVDTFNSCLRFIKVVVAEISRSASKVPQIWGMPLTQYLSLPLHILDHFKALGEIYCLTVKPSACEVQGLSFVVPP